MKVYNLNFLFSYIDCNNFKEKELIVLRNFIKGTRIGREIKFANYANISFDVEDVKHDKPIVTELEQFTRSKTNGIIFNMENTELNNGVFNKCVIYQTLFTNSGAYGYILWNTETNDSVHEFNVEYDGNELIKHIYRTINSLPIRDKLNKMLISSISLKKQKNKLIA